MRLSVGVLGASRRISASPDVREDFLEEVAPESELCRKGEWKNIKQWEQHEPSMAASPHMICTVGLNVLRYKMWDHQPQKALLTL